MNRLLNFSKRNLKEALRDPLIYIFCLGFPVAMMLLFQIINNYTFGNTPHFEINSLLPGIITFSFSFIMLTMSLLVSKDRQTSFLKRLYSSPMKYYDYVLGYFFVGFIIGICQIIICIVSGLIISIILNTQFISFAQALLLMVSQLPILITNIFLGVLIGILFNDKSAPGICSIFISLSGILGGCWMPLETMGGFETFCRFLPFYPSVSLGRIITNATTLSSTTIISLITILAYMVVSVILSFITFKNTMVSDK